jgi:hypothetical protein
MHFAEERPKRDTYTDWCEGFMEYGFEMGSSAVTYIPFLL